jgi:purine-binding chemotaxis protein CheW
MSVPSITEARQYLAFSLGDESFALDVANLREILEFTTVTKVPQTPTFMRGVINLRGNVVPVIDMRLKFNLSRAETTVDTCIIVVEVTFYEEHAVIGALVDSVQEVFELEPGDIEPAPKIGTQLKTEFIKGIGKRDNRFIMILDIEKIFSSDELEAVATTPGMEEGGMAESAA